MKLCLLGLTGVVAGILATTTVTADALDGSKPLLCALTDTSECVAGEGCVRGEAANLNLPDFLEINVADKFVATVDGERSTPIVTVAHDGDNLILQGTQSGRAWSATISQRTGRMTLSAADEGKAFVVFGSCISL